MYFHVFLINYQTSSYGFFGFCLFFPNEIAFSSILTNELKQFVSSAIPSLVKKKTQLPSNYFELMRTLTIYGEYGIMAHIP